VDFTDLQGPISPKHQANQQQTADYADHCKKTDLTIVQLQKLRKRLSPARWRCKREQALDN
jgi:hypothetical protein